MEDTPAAVEARFHRQLMSLTPQERLAMACRMHAAAKALARAAILRDSSPSPEELRVLLFLRFYGQDFGEGEKTKILAWLGGKPGA